MLWGEFWRKWMFHWWFISLFVKITCLDTLSLSLSLSIYIYIYIYICVCVCVCVFFYVWLFIKFCLVVVQGWKYSYSVKHELIGNNLTFYRACKPIHHMKHPMDEYIYSFGYEIWHLSYLWTSLRVFLEQNEPSVTSFVCRHSSLVQNRKW